jgi:hypothetical protein
LVERCPVKATVAGSIPPALPVSKVNRLRCSKRQLRELCATRIAKNSGCRPRVLRVQCTTGSMAGGGCSLAPAAVRNFQWWSWCSGSTSRCERERLGSNPTITPSSNLRRPKNCHSERVHVRNLIPKKRGAASITSLTKDEIPHEMPFGMTSFKWVARLILARNSIGRVADF